MEMRINFLESTERDSFLLPFLVKYISFTFKTANEKYGNN